MNTNAVFDPFILLQQVDAFYQTSWNHLILYTGGAIAIVGVVMPILIQLYQSRVMRMEKKRNKGKREYGGQQSDSQVIRE